MKNPLSRIILLVKSTTLLSQTNTNTSVRDENNMDMMMYACLFERVHLFNLFTKAFTLKIDRVSSSLR